MRYNGRLDSLRAVAALSVIAFHWRNTLPCGWIGVQFFFVLSGFLITEILAKEKDRPDGTIATVLKNFWIRRLLRLLPLYILFNVLLAVVFREPVEQAKFLQALPYIGTYTLNIARMFPGLVQHGPYSHLWSLGIEWQFYLAWPLAVLALSPHRLLLGCWALIIATPFLRLAEGCIAPAVATTRLGMDNFVYNSPLTHLDAFAFGALLAVSPKSRHALQKGSPWIFLAVLAYGVAMLLVQRGNPEYSILSLGYPIFLNANYQYVFGFTLLNALSACIVALCFLPALPRTPLDSRSLQYLGKISYGIYVFHYPVVLLMAVWAKGTSGKLTYNFLALIAAITIVLAALSYELVERHFLRLKSRIKHRGLSANP